MKISVKYGLLPLLMLLVGINQLIAAPTAKSFVDKASNILNKAADTFDDLLITNAKDVFNKILNPLVKSIDDLKIEVQSSGIRPVASGVSFTSMTSAYKKVFVEFKKEAFPEKRNSRNANFTPEDLKKALAQLADVRADIEAIVKALVTKQPKEVADALQYAKDFNDSFTQAAVSTSAGALVQNFAKAIDKATDELGDVTTTNAEHVKKILTKLNTALTKVDTSAGTSGLKPAAVDMNVVFKSLTAFEKGLLEETKATEKKALSRETYLDVTNIALVKEMLQKIHVTLTNFVRKLVLGNQYASLLKEFEDFITTFKAVPTGAQAKPYIEKMEKAFADVLGGLPIVNGSRLIDRLKALNAALLKINQDSTKAFTTPGPLPQPFTLFEKLDVMLTALDKKTTPFATKSPTIFVLDEAVLLPLAKDELTKALNTIIAFCKKAFVRSDMIAERVAHVKEFIATLKKKELDKKAADDEAAARAAAEQESLESGRDYVNDEAPPSDFDEEWVDVNGDQAPLVEDDSWIYELPLVGGPDTLPQPLEEQDSW